MIEPLFLGAFIGISTACALAYALGRYHGLEIGLTERFRPTLTSDWSDEVPGDQFPVFHSASVTEGRQRHHG